MDEERIDWIERWATGWKNFYEETEIKPEEYYSRLHDEVAVDFILELVNTLKDNE